MGDRRLGNQGFTLPLAPRVLIVLAIGSVLVSLIAAHLARVDAGRLAGEQRTRQVRNLAQALAARVAPLLRADDDERLAMLGASAAQFGNCRVLILDAAGSVRLDSGKVMGDRKFELRTAGGAHARSVGAGEHEYLAPVLGLRGLVGEVRVRYGTEATAPSFTVLGGCLLACLSLLAIVGALCHHWTANLRDAVATARRLAHGELSARCTRRAGGVVQEMQHSLHELGAVLGAGAQQIEQSFLELALQSVEVLERRGKVGHGERTRTYAALLARRLGLPPEDCRDIDIAARLHDIGEIYEPPAVPGEEADTAAEFSRMRRTPQRGAELVAGISNLRRVAGIVRHHRERYDGGGFPHGMQGERIPLGARILGIADAYDQLTTVSREGLPPLPWEDALDELRADRGEIFDPWLVDLFEEEIRKAPMPRPRDEPLVVSATGVAPYKEAQRRAGANLGDDEDDTLYWSDELEIELLGDDGRGSDPQNRDTEDRDTGNRGTGNRDTGRRGKGRDDG